MQSTSLWRMVAFSVLLPVRLIDYGLRDYGIDNQIGLEQTLDEYVDSMVQVFREMWRVLKDDGTVWLNIGDSYNSQDAGKNPGGFQGAAMKKNKDMNAAYIRSGTTMKGNIPGLKPKDLIGIPWMVAMSLLQGCWAFIVMESTKILGGE